MSGREAFNKFRNYGGKLHRKDWEEGKFIAFNVGKRRKTKDGFVFPGRRFYDQDDKTYKDSEDLLSSVNIDSSDMLSEEDIYDYYEL